MGKTIHEKYMDAMAYMDKTMKADNAAGHTWKYCNVTGHKAKDFESARKQGKYLLNCVDGVQWACRIAGIPSSALAWYGSRGIAWCGTNAQANAKKYFQIIKVGNKTVRQCLTEGLLCEGDILTYVSLSHTNAYYKDGKSWDSGHAFCTRSSGEHVPFTKWIGSLRYPTLKVSYILRIKDRKHYRVQAGAYKSESMAKEKQKLLSTKFKINSTIKIEDGMYKIQLGYFDGKENAEKYRKKMLTKTKMKDNEIIVKEL